MTFDEFSRKNIHRCQSPQGFGHAIDLWSESDWFTAAIGEAGELANVLKKLNRIRDGARGNRSSETFAALKKEAARELADTLIYLDLLATRLGFDLGEIVRETFNAKSDEIGYPERI